MWSVGAAGDDEGRAPGVDELRLGQQRQRDRREGEVARRHDRGRALRRDGRRSHGRDHRHHRLHVRDLGAEAAPRRAGSRRAQHAVLERAADQRHEQGVGVLRQPVRLDDGAEGRLHRAQGRRQARRRHDEDHRGDGADPAALGRLLRGGERRSHRRARACAGRQGVQGADRHPRGRPLRRPQPTRKAAASPSSSWPTRPSSQLGNRARSSCARSRSSGVRSRSSAQRSSASASSYRPRSAYASATWSDA